MFVCRGVSVCVEGCQCLCVGVSVCVCVEGCPCVCVWRGVLIYSVD